MTSSHEDRLVLEPPALCIPDGKICGRCAVNEHAANKGCEGMMKNEGKGSVRKRALQT